MLSKKLERLRRNGVLDGIYFDCSSRSHWFNLGRGSRIGGKSFSTKSHISIWQGGPQSGWDEQVDGGMTSFGVICFEGFSLEIHFTVNVVEKWKSMIAELQTNKTKQACFSWNCWFLSALIWNSWVFWSERTSQLCRRFEKLKSTNNFFSFTTAQNYLRHLFVSVSFTDEDGNGTVSFIEFLLGLAKLAGSTSEAGCG